MRFHVALQSIEGFQKTVIGWVEASFKHSGDVVVGHCVDKDVLPVVLIQPKVSFNRPKKSLMD